MFHRIILILLIALSCLILGACGVAARAMPPAATSTALPAATSVAPAKYTFPSSCKTCDTFQRQMQDSLSGGSNGSGE